MVHDDDRRSVDLRAASGLERAAQYLVANGWVKGRFGDYSNSEPCCATAAIGGVLPDDYRARNFAEAALRLHFDGVGIIQWNDAPGRTSEQVIEALRATANRIRLSWYATTNE